MMIRLKNYLQFRRVAMLSMSFRDGINLLRDLLLILPHAAHALFLQSVELVILSLQKLVYTLMTGEIVDFIIGKEIVKIKLYL